MEKQRWEEPEKRRRKKIREEKELEERRCRWAFVVFSNDSWLWRVEKYCR